MVLLLLPLSLAMDDSEFDNGNVIGSGGSPVAAAAVAQVVVNDDWQQKRLAKRALLAA